MCVYFTISVLIKLVLFNAILNRSRCYLNGVLTCIVLFEQKTKRIFFLSQWHRQAFETHPNGLLWILMWSVRRNPVVISQALTWAFSVSFLQFPGWDCLILQWMMSPCWGNFTRSQGGFFRRSGPVLSLTLSLASLESLWLIVLLKYDLWMIRQNWTWVHFYFHLFVLKDLFCVSFFLYVYMRRTFMPGIHGGQKSTWASEPLKLS